MWEEVAAEALETAGRRMLNGENGTPVSPAGAGVAVASGVAGVELFAGDVPRWPDLLGGDGTEVALRSLSVFVEKAGTGGGLFRRLQTSFCHEVAERTGCVLADDAAHAYRAGADTWSRLGAGAVGGGSLDSRLSLVAELARSVRDLERRAAESLIEAAKALR